jgi:hypothetical protein
MRGKISPVAPIDEIDRDGREEGCGPARVSYVHGLGRGPNYPDQVY